MNKWEKFIELAGTWIVIIFLAGLLVMFVTVAANGETVWTPIDGRTVVGEPTSPETPPVVCQPAGNKVVCW